MEPPSEPQRVAFAGDWHANTRWAVAAIKYAKNNGAEVIVHVGDFGFTFERPFVDAVAEALTGAALPLLFVEGNHDDPGHLRGPVDPSGLREIAPNLWHIPRGVRWQWGGLTWLGCGGAHSVDRPWRTPGVSWWPEETITDADVTRCIEGGAADILIAHDCPAGVHIPGLNGAGSFPLVEIDRAEQHRVTLRRVVDGCQPKLIVHGHYHRPYRTEVNFGYGPVAVCGLGMDGVSFDDNVWIVDLVDLKVLAS